MKAAVYLRISQDPKADGLAIERQRGECLAIVQSRGWELVREPYADTVSASKRNVKRPQYEAMREAFDRGDFQALVCWDLDRLTRQPREVEDWIDAAEKRGLKLVTVSGDDDLTTREGMLHARIKASIAADEGKHKSDRQKAKNRQNIERGLPVPGRRRYGYETDGITPIESEARIVRFLFSSVLRGRSLYGLTKALQERGVSPAPGREWSTRRLRDILMSPVYAGYIVHGQGPQRQAVKSDHVAPIVKAETAERVRTLLQDPKRRTTPGNVPQYLPSGIALCGVCGASLVHMRGYRCRESSAHVFITRETLDARVRAEVAAGLLFAHGRRSEALEVPSAAHDELTAVLKARARILGLVSADAITDAEAMGELADLKRREEAAEIEIRAHVSRAAGANIWGYLLQRFEDRTVSIDGTAATKAVILEQFDTLALDQQKELMQGLGDVVVHKGRNNAQRVRVWHKVATTLNPEGIEAGEWLAEPH